MNLQRGYTQAQRLGATAGLFEGTWDLFETGTVRHTDSGMIVMKEAADTHRSLETGPHGQTPGSVRRQRE